MNLPTHFTTTKETEHVEEITGKGNIQKAWVGFAPILQTGSDASPRNQHQEKTSAVQIFILILISQ